MLEKLNDMPAGIDGLKGQPVAYLCSAFAL